MPLTTFAVCRTAEIPAEIVDRFLKETYTYAEDLAPGIGPCLAVLGDTNNITEQLASPTPAGSAANLPPSQFIGISSPREVSQRLGPNANMHFIIMDKQSTEDDSVLLVHNAADSESENDVQTVTARVSFKSAQIVCCSLDVGSQGFEEIRIIAADSPGGVYAPEREEQQPQRGEPAPRMVLGGGD